MPQFKVQKEIIRLKLPALTDEQTFILYEIIEQAYIEGLKDGSFR